MCVQVPKCDTQNTWQCDGILVPNGYCSQEFSDSDQLRQKEANGGGQRRKVCPNWMH